MNTSKSRGIGAYGQVQRQGALQRSVRWIVRVRWLFLLSAIALCACHQTPDEVQIRQSIANGQRAVKQGDAAMLRKLLSEDFVSENDQASAADLLNMLQLAHLRGESVDVQMGAITLEPRGDRYVANFSATLSSASGLLPDQMSIYKVTTGWRHVDGEWRCYTLNWER